MDYYKMPKKSTVTPSKEVSEPIEDKECEATLDAEEYEEVGVDEEEKEGGDVDQEGNEDEGDEGEGDDDNQDEEEEDDELEEGDDVLQQMARKMVEKKIAFTFNRLFIDFLKDVKGKSKTLSHAIKKNYKCLDKMSAEYIEYWDVQFGSDAAGSDWQSKVNAEVFKGVSLQMVLDNVGSADVAIVSKYMYTLGLLNYVFRELDDSNASGVDDLFNSILECIKTMDSNGDMAHILQNIVDDDVKTVLESMARLAVVLPSSAEDASGGADQASASGSASASSNSASDDFFETSKIGKLAKEISSSIDINKLNIKDPSDLLNMQKLMSGEGNEGLASIIQQVGSTITSKIQSGELKQEELIADAMSLVSKLNSGKKGRKEKGGPADLAAALSVMGGMGNMGGAVGDMMKMMSEGIKKKSGKSTRDRLREKIAKRKHEAQAQDETQEK